MPKEYTIRGFFESYEPEKKLHITLLNDEVDSFTRKLLYSYYSPAQNNPIVHDDFYVKYDKKSLFFLDKANTHLVMPNALVGMQVSMQVCFRHYNFTNQQGKKIIGWNIYLKIMSRL
jgi:hypothetical protein